MFANFRGAANVICRSVLKVCLLMGMALPSVACGSATVNKGTGGVDGSSGVAGSGRAGSSAGSGAPGGTAGAGSGAGGTVGAGSGGGGGGAAGTGASGGAGGAGNGCNPSCGAAKPICEDGSCVACASDTKRCDGNTPSICMNGNWVDQSPCAGTAPACSNGVCGAARLVGTVVTVAQTGATGTGARLVEHGLVSTQTQCGTVAGQMICVSGGIAP